ncbi:hypothetical protein ASG29_11800 [Sphingomonas sp. Leaf412]|uniref:I78 family peptidase inhibitor n=1 Tax=Sphingomonas sp. Leaf412 TaxID=1736370 RepID=UPI0006FEBD73|nr:I78 family peptidase inhibitor [Sphingomonas sp. Leaf412]KQT32456.1 hypothetical protein ASG29_11800 [Sphingomonas sp. Leaf412]
MRILTLACMAPLAACTANPPRLPPATTPAPPAEAAVPGTRCDANAAQRLIGTAADTSAAEAQRLSGARTVRRYRTGDMLTMDLRPDRLNVETDAAGRIVKLTCG